MNSAFDFHLCHGQKENLIGSQILSQCLNRLIEVRGSQHGIISLVLTGSLSRGEGTVLCGPDGRVQVLGDVEFLVVYPRNENLPLRRKELHKMANLIEKALSKEGISCELDFTPVQPDFFRRLKPTIFNFELRQYGKVVWGKPDLLEEIPAMKPSDIPKLDAFYLLCNRMIEQLILYQSLKSGIVSHPPLQEFYQLIKIYIDMAGSFLTFIGQYEPSYKSRLTAFSHLREDLSYVELRPFFNGFYDRLAYATSFKLLPDQQKLQSENSELFSPEATRYLLKLFSETIDNVKTLWIWEIKNLAKPSGDEDLRDLEEQFLKTLSLKARCRSWAKLWWIAHQYHHHLNWQRMLRLLFKGTPQALLYMAAAEIYFGLADEILEENIVRRAEHFLPIASNESTKEDVIQDIIDIWIKFIRNF